MHVQDIGITPLIKYIPQNILSGATINGNVVLQFDKLPTVNKYVHANVGMFKHSLIHSFISLNLICSYRLLFC